MSPGYRTILVCAAGGSRELRACPTLIAANCSVEQALRLCFVGQLYRRADALIADAALSKLIDRMGWSDRLSFGGQPIAAQPEVELLLQKCDPVFPLTAAAEGLLKPRKQNRGDSDRKNLGKLRMELGVPGGIRTHGPKIRNLVLYPAELRRHAIPYSRNRAETKLHHHRRGSRPSIGYAGSL